MGEDGGAFNLPSRFVAHTAGPQVPAGEPSFLYVSFSITVDLEAAPGVTMTSKQ